MSQLNEAEKERELYKGELSGSIIERAGTYISEFIKKEHLKAKEAKRRNSQTVLSELEQFFNRLDAILNRMNEIADDLNEIEKKLQTLNEVERLYKEGKFDFNNPEHITMLTQTGVNIEDFEANGLDTLNARRNELIYDKERLIKEYHSLEDEFQNELKNRPDGVTEQEVLEKYSDRLEDLHSKVKDQNIVNNAIEDYRVSKGGSSQLFEDSSDKVTISEYEKPDLSDIKDQSALVNQQNDPFAEVAKISDPFNEVASTMKNQEPNLQSGNTIDNAEKYQNTSGLGFT
jgi:uncharacterized protein YoxC